MSLSKQTILQAKPTISLSSFYLVRFFHFYHQDMIDLHDELFYYGIEISGQYQ